MTAQTAYSDQKAEPIVCFNYDDFLQDKDESVWVAKLSDGSTVYQDDKRPGLHPISWFRLMAYCYENNLNITDMFVKFRSHIEHSCSPKDGVFFIRSLLGSISFEGKTHQYYIIGSVNGREIHCKHWKLPELLCEEEDDRSLDSDAACKFNWEEKIIWNRNENQMLANQNT